MAKNAEKSEFEEGSDQADNQRAADAGAQDGANNDWDPKSEDTEAQKGAYSRNWRESYDKTH